MKAKINRENISKHLVEYQLNMVGKTLEDTLSDDMWFFNWTMTPDEHEEFKAYAIPLMKKIFKFNKSRAEQTFGWFNLQFGLRIKT
jgi:hypothetical protein